MKYFILTGLLLMYFSCLSQSTRHVVLISIDGLRPEMYLDSTWPSPNLRLLMKTGVYARHMKSVFPSFTYPSHTAMLTGALPARSGIYFNQPKNSRGEWNWFCDSIKVPTLWQAFKKAGLTTAAVEWPVSVSRDITWDIPEIWDPRHPEDRITAARQYATPGLIAEVEQYATGILDSNSMSEDWLSLDEQAARAAGYIFKTHKPAFLALHFACVDGMEHEFGREGDSVRLALAAVDRAIGDMMEAIQKAGLRDSTVVIIVGDHGFSTIHTVFRPNMLIKDLPARFIAAGGSAFLYPLAGTQKEDIPGIVRSTIERLDSLPADKRKRFRVLFRPELDSMGADSSAILALAAMSGTVFSGSTGARRPANQGPGTLIQQNPLEGLFIPTAGGHHGYDPDNPEMYTGFIANGPDIRHGAFIPELTVTDIAPLVARLLGVPFTCPDGDLVPGILSR